MPSGVALDTSAAELAVDLICQIRDGIAVPELDARWVTLVGCPAYAAWTSGGVLTEFRRYSARGA